MHCEVAFAATVDGLQTSVTEEIVGDPPENGLLPLPQANIVSRSREPASAWRTRIFKHILLRLHCKLLIIVISGEGFLSAW